MKSTLDQTETQTSGRYLQEITPYAVDYLFATYETQLTVNSTTLTELSVPLPHRTILLVSTLAIIGLASTLLVRRRRSKLYPRSFEYFKEMTHGGLPETCFTVIIGDSGSGKSILLNSLAGEHLASHKAIYITNTEYPEKIRENLVKLGVCEEANVQPDKLIFIDAVLCSWRKPVEGTVFHRIPH